MSIFNDSFSKRAFARFFLMVFDEMGKSQQTDVNLLKNIITAPTIDWRGLGSETMNSAPQNCTFIGCSNSPLRERIHDPTSSRRFWQLNCAQKLNWERINSIDYLSLWQSVDQNAPCPILDCLDAIRAVQEHEIRHQDLIESWLQSVCEPAPFDSNSPTTEQLYSAFSGWAREQSIFDYDGLQIFSRGLQLRIDQLKWAAGAKRTHKGTTWSLCFKDQIPEPKPILGLSAGSEAVSAEAIEPKGEA